jgi:hypothetical protein
VARFSCALIGAQVDRRANNSEAVNLRHLRAGVLTGSHIVPPKKQKFYGYEQRTTRCCSQNEMRGYNNYSHER